MSTTPQTDAAAELARPVCHDSMPRIREYVPLEFARQLERENAALRKAKEMLEVERCECLRTMDLALNESAGLREDKERLDWLESLNGPWPTYYDGWHSRSGSHDSLRDAIDANRKKAQP